MKLSEAIRLGSMLKPQGHGSYRKKDGGTCALGAAADAIGHRGMACITAALLDAFPVLAVANDRACPVRGCRDCPVGGGVNTIPHLNDDHMWTREQIADWVEAIEREEERLQASPETEDAVASCRR